MSRENGGVKGNILEILDALYSLPVNRTFVQLDGPTLRQLRTYAGMSQADLGLSWVSQSRVARAESNQGIARMAAEEIATRLGAPLTVLLKVD